MAGLHAALAELLTGASSSGNDKRREAINAALVVAAGNRTPAACLSAIKELLDQRADRACTASGYALPPALLEFLAARVSEMVPWTAEQVKAVLTALLAAGANPSQRVSTGLAPLDLAVQLSCANACKQAVTLLLQAGADASAAEPGRQRTALHFAAYNPNPQAAVVAVETLAAAGADLLAADADGNVPAVYANCTARAAMSNRC
jgi:ankyrin repeat protein